MMKKEHTTKESKYGLKTYAKGEYSLWNMYYI